MPAMEVVPFPDATRLAGAAAERIICSAHDAIPTRGRFHLVLAGGSTPEKTYTLLAKPNNAARVDWTRVFLYFGDERMVPPDDARSNFRMARSAFLATVPIPETQIFR